MIDADICGGHHVSVSNCWPNFSLDYKLIIKLFLAQSCVYVRKEGEVTIRLI